MASHRGHDERMRAALLQVVADSLTSRARLSIPRLPAAMAIRAPGRISVVQRCQLRSQRAAWIVETRAIEPLPDFEELMLPALARSSIEIGRAPTQHICAGMAHSPQLCVFH